jgi:uncharacterized protein with HEPN domain
MPLPFISAEDSVRLQHMVEAGLAAVEFVTGVSQSDFAKDQMRLFAVLRALEIIGEAANKVSDELHAATPQIEWSAMIGMRIILAHHYFDVDVNVVWEAVTEDVPRLIEELRLLLEVGKP